ncbi:hypothetical protein, partial [Nocardia abscessus]|uniref:hypothetical protein n=1 Tax=Nocardia abscessus TaxID=120957 RepID=UPI0024567C06
SPPPRLPTEVGGLGVRRRGRGAGGAPGSAVWSARPIAGGTGSSVIQHTGEYFRRRIVGI